MSRSPRRAADCSHACAAPSSGDGLLSRSPYLHVDASLARLERAASVALGVEEAHHLGTVLRGGSGRDVEVADGAGWWAPAVLEPPATVRLRADAVHVAAPTPRLHLVQGLPKGRKLDEVVRTATELGVDVVTPVVSARAVVRIDGDRGERAVRRWRAVARAASEQSRRAWRPHIGEVASITVPLPASLAASDVGAGERDAARAPFERLVLVAHPGGRPLPEQLPAAAEVDEVVLAVGPEGGWTDGEVAGLVAAGAVAVGFGPSVLRTEHAGAAGLAVLAAGIGRWSSATGAVPDVHAP